MKVRSPSQLRQDQARLRLDAASPVSVETIEVALRSEQPKQLLGRVSQVVTTDAVRGPHLRVVAQVHTGTPPKPTDASAHDTVRYPPPGRSVTDYAVGEYVWLIDVKGARLAAKLA